MVSLFTKQRARHNTTSTMRTHIEHATIQIYAFRMPCTSNWGMCSSVSEWASERVCVCIWVYAYLCAQWLNSVDEFLSLCTCTIAITKTIWNSSLCQSIDATAFFICFSVNARFWLLLCYLCRIVWQWELVKMLPVVRRAVSLLLYIVLYGDAVRCFITTL